MWAHCWTVGYQSEVAEKGEDVCDGSWDLKDCQSLLGKASRRLCGSNNSGQLCRQVEGFGGGLKADTRWHRCTQGQKGYTSRVVPHTAEVTLRLCWPRPYCSCTEKILFSHSPKERKRNRLLHSVSLTLPPPNCPTPFYLPPFFWGTIISYPDLCRSLLRPYSRSFCQWRSEECEFQACIFCALPAA